MKGERTIETPANWTHRQLALAALLLVAFIATAAVVPVLIAPSDPKGVAAAAPAPAEPTPAGSTPAPTPSSTPTPTRTVSPFLVRPAVQPRPVKNPPHRIYREFQSICALARQSSKAPLAGLAPAGRKVGYQFAGSTSAALAEPGRLPSGSTSCLTAGDRSLYWTPIVRQGRQILRPESFEVFYKAGVDDYTGVQPFPTGLRLIVGGPAGAATAPDQGRVSWSCTDYNEPTLPTPGTCKDGDRLTMRLTAPSCWDGAHLDVPGHRGHLTWPLTGRCPGGHPVAVPELLLRIAYPLDGTGELTVDSGPDEEFGFGFIAGWQRAALAKLLKTCINAGQLCDANGSPS